MAIGVQLAEDYCPHCGGLLDAATAAFDDDHQPSEGDVSVCLYCHQYLRYGAKLKLELLGRKDYLALPDDLRRQLKKVRRVIMLGEKVFPKKKK